MKYKDPAQLSIFGDEPEEAPVKMLFHIFAVDKFDNTLEDDIEAVSWKQACYLFKKKHGFYWQCH